MKLANQTWKAVTSQETGVNPFDDRCEHEIKSTEIKTKQNIKFVQLTESKDHFIFSPDKIHLINQPNNHLKKIVLIIF